MAMSPVSRLASRMPARTERVRVALSQAVVPAELAHRDDEVLPGHHDDLLDQGTGLQGQQGADQHRLVSQG